MKSSRLPPRFSAEEPGYEASASLGELDVGVAGQVEHVERPIDNFVQVLALTATIVSDSRSSSQRHKIFPLINYAGSGHANRLRFERSRCILVRRTPINYISLGCSMPVLSIDDSW